MQIRRCLFHVLQAGLHHKILTAFLDHSFEVNIQLSKSVELLSFRKMFMRISAGRQLAGEVGSRCTTAGVSAGVAPPIEDCESLLLMKKSDSSYSARVGELLEEERESPS